MSENEDFFKLASIKHCPICNEKLEKGYITSQRSIFWDTKRHHWQFFTIKEELKSMWEVRARNFPTLRCHNCRIIISYYGEERRS